MEGGGDLARTIPTSNPDPDWPRPNQKEKSKPQFFVFYKNLVYEGRAALYLKFVVVTQVNKGASFLLLLLLLLLRLFIVPTRTAGSGSFR